MSRISSITVGVLLTALVAGNVAAQWNVARFETERNRVYTTFGVDPAFVSSLGYGRVVHVKGHDFQLTGDAGVATANMDKRDFRARVGTQTSLARWRSVHLTGSTTFITRGTANMIYRGINFGADMAGAVGVYRQGWFGAGEFGFDKAIVTHVSHTDWYRKYVYADAKNGWYLDTGGTYHYGVTGGFALGRTEVAGRFGWRRTERFNAVMMPMYASVGVGLGL